MRVAFCEKIAMAYIVPNILPGMLAYVRFSVGNKTFLNYTSCIHIYKNLLQKNKQQTKTDGKTVFAKCRVLLERAVKTRTALLVSARYDFIFITELF